MSSWVPESERTPAWEIFNYQFMCRVPNIQTMSTDYLKHFGMPVTGSVQHDNEITNELVIRMLTINQMVEFHKRGVTIAVVNYSDTKLIYEKITEHLNVWKDVIRTSLHTRNAPVEDLLLLDKFAGVVYEHAVSQFNTEIVDSLIARRASSTMRVSRDKLLPALVNTTINPITEGAEIANPYPTRPSMADYFSNATSSRSLGSKWR